MTQPASTAPGVGRWTGFVVAALPLLVLLLLFASGIAIPFWIYALVLLWCLLMPFWMRGHGGEHGAAHPAAHSGHADRLGQPLIGTDTAEAPEASRRLADAVPASLFAVSGWEVQPSGLVLRGALRAPVATVQEGVAAAARAVLGRAPQVMVHETSGRQPYLFIPSADLQTSLERAVPRHRPWVNLGLLAATLVTTTFAGATHQGVDLLRNPGAWTTGLPYALGVMLILGVHEMGHYLAARRHGVRVSLPYFIPMPFGLGTFGAFISMPPLLKNRRQLFDIGVAGPLAGLAVAIPALVIGLQWSKVLPVADATAGQMGPMSQGG